MTHQEILERIYAAWGKGDYTSTEYLHPDIEMTFSPGFLEEGHYEGISGIWHGWRSWLDQWESWTYEVVRYIELDDGRIAVPIRLNGIAKTTGIQLASLGANLWEFEDGMVRRLWLYAHADDLLQQLGIDDPDA